MSTVAAEVSEGKSVDQLPTKRSDLKIRWLVLALLCIGLIGSYYSYDIPAAINNPLTAHFSNRKDYDKLFGLLYSVYSWPNTVLPLFGGFISDRFGVRLTNVVFAGLVLAGQLVFAVGLTLNQVDASWAVMLTGRVIFGLGAESLSVTMSAMIAQWFAGKELALALGMNLALARVGSVINDVTSLAIAQKFPIYWALWFGGVVCAISFLCGIAVFYIDRNASRQLRRNRRTLRMENARRQRGHDHQGRPLGPGPSGAMFWVEDDIAMSPAMQQHTPLLDDHGQPINESADEDVDKEGLEDETVDLRAIFKFPLTFWVLTLSCLTVYCTVLPFNNIASKFVKIKYHYSDHKANQMLLITYLVAGLLSPFLGAGIDRVGLRAALNLVAAALIVGVHSVLGYTTMSPIGPLVVLGLCYAVYASALWPSIALVVPAEYAATAYGLVTAVQNLGLAVMPIIIGSLQGKCPEDYTCVENAFIALGAVGVLCGIALNAADCAADYPILNSSEDKIKRLRAEDASMESAALLDAGPEDRAAGEGKQAPGQGASPYRSSQLEPSDPDAFA